MHFITWDGAVQLDGLLTLCRFFLHGFGSRVCEEIDRIVTSENPFAKEHLTRGQRCDAQTDTCSIAVWEIAAMFVVASVQPFLDWPTLARMHRCCSTGTPDNVLQAGCEQPRGRDQSRPAVAKQFWLTIGLPLLNLHGEEVLYCPGVARNAWARVYIMGLPRVYRQYQLKRNRSRADSFAPLARLVPQVETGGDIKESTPEIKLIKSGIQSLPNSSNNSRSSNTNTSANNNVKNKNNRVWTLEWAIIFWDQRKWRETCSQNTMTCIA